jgi:hypothetical protein
MGIRHTHLGAGRAVKHPGRNLQPTVRGSASDLLRLCAESAREDISLSPPWAKNTGIGRPTAAGAEIPSHPGHEIAFSREGLSGAIRMNALGHSRSRAVGMDSDDGQNEMFRANGGLWSASA